MRNRSRSIEITVKENQNTVKLNNVLDSTSDSSMASTPIKRSHSVRERSRHESSDAEFEGIHTEPRRGSMTLNSSITKGQRAHLSESLTLNCSKHPNSISPSVSKENVSRCHQEETKDTKCDKNAFRSFSRGSNKSRKGDGSKSTDTSATVKGNLSLSGVSVYLSNDPNVRIISYFKCSLKSNRSYLSLRLTSKLKSIVKLNLSRATAHILMYRFWRIRIDKHPIVCSLASRNAFMGAYFY